MRQHPLEITAMTNAKLFLIIVLAASEAMEASPLWFLLPAIVVLLALLKVSWCLHPWELARCCSVAIAAWSCCCGIMADQVLRATLLHLKRVLDVDRALVQSGRPERSRSVAWFLSSD